MPGIDPQTAAAVVDLAAYRRNIERLKRHAGTAAMVVLKADAYGHGLITCARSARVAGADWLGAATPAEALAIRDAGDDGPLLCWLYGPDEELSGVIAAGVDVAAHTPEQLSMITADAATAERTAAVQLKIDTGLFRNGSSAARWPELCAAAREAEEVGAIEVTGLWTHLAAADEPGHHSIERQLAAFEDAIGIAESHGLRPRLRHAANSAAAIGLPQARYDLVRLGIAGYGIEPAPGLAVNAGVELEPVMTLQAQLAAVKPIAAGAGVSYGHTWVAEQDSVVGLVPLGYADGVPRHASNRAAVGVANRTVPIRGRVCMDQFVVDLGPDATARVGDRVVLFGTGADGPTAADWADACDTIGYEIVTRIGARVPRIYLNGDDPQGPATMQAEGGDGDGQRW